MGWGWSVWPVGGGLPTYSASQGLEELQAIRQFVLQMWKELVTLCLGTGILDHNGSSATPARSAGTSAVLEQSGVTPIS